MFEPIPLTSEKLLAAGFVHGFFTRLGGCSAGGFSTLNSSYSVGDDPSCITTNLARISAKLGLAPDHLVTISQVHGTVVEPFDADCDVPSFALREADALFGLSEAHGFAVRTADCVPILIGCQRTGAAAAIHAGWRGIAAGVIFRTIEALIRHGSRPESLVACIGPHIGQRAFEVSEEVASTLQAVAPAVRATSRTTGAKPHVALGLLVAAQLEQAGLPKMKIEDLGVCTYSNEKDFFSFRRDGKSSGRQISVIRPLK